MRFSVPKLVVIVVICHWLSGCYYWQAAQGQWSLSRARVPVDVVVADAKTDDTSRRKLSLAREALEFAHRELKLPDNGSYKDYVALDRDYVVVNVFAAAEFSLAPKTWCYPIAGCLAYRGYFDAEDAAKKATRMREQGYDVMTGKVPAYSTLGRFRDPIVSTMLSRSDDGLVSLLFHELAHQVVYVQDDTAFNESFASAVAEIGLARWRDAGNPVADIDHDKRRRIRQRLFELLAELRSDLSMIYEMTASVDEKRRKKQARFDALASAWRATGATSRPPVNNAALVPLALYNDLTPAFVQLYEQSGRDMGVFLEAVQQLAARPKAERDQVLTDLAEP
ncbi:MAG: aminopeptidase [Pseudomonadota bacterium]